MGKEPQKAQKSEPASIEPALRQGPAYDPMDRIVQDLQNIQSFLNHLDEYPEDASFVDAHLQSILSLRRTIAHQIDFLSEEPYRYSTSKLSLLKKENETLFSYLEGAVGSLKGSNSSELKRFLKICDQTISKFDGNLTP